MVTRYLSPNLILIYLGGIREKDIDGRTTDARIMTVALLYSSRKQS